MKNLIERLKAALGLSSNVGAPVHAGANPVYFTNVYRDKVDGRWVFSWRSADHSQGEVRDGFFSKADAEAICKYWSEHRLVFEHARCVHENA